MYLAQLESDLEIMIKDANNFKNENEKLKDENEKLKNTMKKEKQAP